MKNIKLQYSYFNKDITIRKIIKKIKGVKEEIKINK